MTTRNDITGDKIQSKVPSQQYKDNYDRIFGKQSRIDHIGQNGNDGEHYECQALEQPADNG
jgi:hypothetical protein